MKPVVYNGHYIVNEDQMDFEHPVEIHFTRFGNSQRPLNGDRKELHFKENTFKVFCNFNEPTTSENTETTEDVISHSHLYDLIITSRDEIIEECDNAVFFPYGSTWLYKDLDHKDGIGFYHPSIDKLHENKTNDISFLITNHRKKEGYEIRHEVWNKQDQIKNRLFYSSTRNPVSQNTLPNDDKKELFKSKFSIVIESSKEENYFTEKICDAIISKTVPIYWGCPNIDDFFDPRGMIICETADEIIEACKKVDQNFDLYDEMKEHIDANFEKAKKYCESLTTRISNEIQLKLKDKKFKKWKPTEPPRLILTVGILTLHERKPVFDELVSHLTNIAKPYTNKVEFVVARDNGEKSVGQKRNEVLKEAKGEFVCFIDDDDTVADSYFDYLIQTLEKHAVDAVGFKGMYYVSEKPTMIFSHSGKNGGHFQTHDSTNGVIQHRPINHLNPVRTTIAREIGFPEQNYGEDTNYCDRLLASGLLKSEAFIDVVLYHYLFDSQKSRTQGV